MLKNHWFRGLLILTLCGTCLVVFPLMYPQVLFAYKVEQGNLSIRSDYPVPAEEGTFILSEISKRLDTSPLKLPQEPMQLYIPHEGSWRMNWVWIIPPKEVGGFVVVPFTGRHAFLSGADYTTNELIAPTGYRPLPPRTLSYYGVHELTHVVIARKVGAFSFYEIPVWINEGLADYAALSGASAADLYAAIGEGEADRDTINDHGFYAPYRLLVTYFLEEEGWSVDQLLESRMPLEEAREVVFSNLRGQQ